MERGLTNRHVQVMAIAGNNRNRAFLRCRSLYQPYWSFYHSDLYDYRSLYVLMMRAVGEMLYQDPEQHTFIKLYHPSFGKGWGYFSVWS